MVLPGEAGVSAPPGVDREIAGRSLTAASGVGDANVLGKHFGGRAR
jgi:hypothetical protein